jgi:hypothetical protein
VGRCIYYEFPLLIDYSIDSLSTQAQKIFEDAAEAFRPKSLDDLLPAESQLDSLLEEYTWEVPDASLAITNALHGAIGLITIPNIGKPLTQTQGYDRQGLKPLMRGAMYCLDLLHDESAVKMLPAQRQVQITRFLAISSQLIADQLNVPSQRPLWSSAAEDLEHDTLDAVVSFQARVSGWLSQLSASRPSRYAPLVTLLFEKSAGESSTEYYHARAYAALVGEERDHHGGEMSAFDESLFGTIRRSTHVIQSTAFLSTATDSRAALKVCNELMSDLSGTDLVEGAPKGKLISPREKC